MTAEMQPGSRFWLHVYDDGREKWFKRPPTVTLTLTVDVVEQSSQKIVEQTYTHDYRIEERARDDFGIEHIHYEYFSARPRGEGWKEFAHGFDHKGKRSTTWRRVRWIGKTRK